MGPRLLELCVPPDEGIGGHRNLPPVDGEGFREEFPFGEGDVGVVSRNLGCHEGVLPVCCGCVDDHRLDVGRRGGDHVLPILEFCPSGVVCGVEIGAPGVGCD